MTLPLVSFCLVFSVYCFTWTEGIKCYDCIYINSDDVPDSIKNIDAFDKSCHFGNTPNDRFLEDCDPDKVCVTQYAVKSTPSLGSAEITARNCMAKFDDLLNKCTDKAAPKFFEYRDLALNFFLTFIEMGQKPTVCSCDEDKCNGGRE